MPRVVEASPRAYYVILGATHPDLLRRDGEAYRTKLVTWRAPRRRGAGPVRGSVRDAVGAGAMADRGRHLRHSLPEREQIVSGTLAYAMSAGKAIVSTRYPYAVEMLEGGRGRLVASTAPGVLAESLIELLSDDDLRRRLGRRAYEFSRSMIWSQVGARYRQIFERVSAGQAIPAAIAHSAADAQEVEAQRFEREPVARLAFPLTPALAPATDGRSTRSAGSI